MAKTSEEKGAPERAWYKDGLPFTCTQCGHCCKIRGYVWVDDEQARVIAEHLGLDEKRFAEKYLRTVNGHLSLTEKPNHECVFWENGCSIYPVRPTQCRTFPFWPYQLRNQANWDKAAEECPGMNSGRVYSFAEIERLRKGRGQTGKAEKRK